MLQPQKPDKNERGSTQTPQLTNLTVVKLVDTLLGTLVIVWNKLPSKGTISEYHHCEGHFKGPLFIGLK